MWLLPLILSSLSLAVTSGDFIKTCDEQQHTSVSVTPTGSASLCVKTGYKPHAYVKVEGKWVQKGTEKRGLKIDWKKDDRSNFTVTIVALNLSADRTYDLQFYPFYVTAARKSLIVTVHVVRATPQEPAETIPRTSAPPKSRVNQANSPKEQKEDSEDREKGGARQQGEDDGDHNETHESGCPDGSIVLGKFCAVFHKKRSSMADAHTVCQYNNMSLWADGLSSSDFDILKKNVDVIPVWTGQRHKINCVIFKLNKELERKINCTMQRKFFCFSARQGLDGQTQTTTNPALTHSTTPQTQTQTHKTTSTVAMVTTASTPIYDTSSSPGAGDAATTGYPPTITSTTTTATTPTTTTALTTTTPPTTTTTTTTTTSTALRSTRSTRRYFRTTTTSKHTETESTVTSARCFPPSTVRGQCPLGWLTKRDNSCVAFLMTSSYLDGHNNCSKKGGKLFSIGETERPCVADFLNNIRYVWYGADQSWCKVQDLSSGRWDWKTCQTQYHYPCEVSLPLPSATVEQITANRKRTKADVTKGDPLNLRCTYGGVALSPVRIIREDLNLTLASSSSNSSNSFTFSKARAECEDQGLYRCQAGSAAQGKRLELGVRGCKPKLCSGKKEEKEPKTVFFDPSSSDYIKFQLCVVAFPNLLNSIKLNKTSVKTKINYKEHRVTFMPVHRGLYQHMVEIELRDKSYRAEMSLEVELISNEYNRATVLVELRPVGCPKSLSAIGSSFNYVTLSWKPVPEFDMNQSYYVFYSKVSEGAWHRSHMRENNPMGDLVSWNVTGLTQDSRYVFKVVALSHGARVDDVIQNYCSKEVSEATAVLPSAETTTPEVERGAGVETGNSQSLRPGSIKNGEGEGDDEDSSGVAVPVVVCLVVGILVAVVVAAVFYRRRARRQNQSGKLCDEQSLEDMDQGEVVYANVPRRRGGDNSASPQPGLVSEPVQVQGTDQDDGRFVTEEGLVYVTVQHARQQSQKWKANKKKTKCAEAEEPVEYVRLDFEKMKSLELSGEKAGEEK